MKRLWLIPIIVLLMLPALTNQEALALPRLKNFESVEQLTEWAQSHVTVLLWGDGKPTTCVDYALFFQDEAFREGFRMSFAYAVDGYVAPGIKVTNLMGYHWGNLAIAGYGVYFIEPQPASFKITYVGPVGPTR